MGALGNVSCLHVTDAEITYAIKDIYMYFAESLDKK